MKRGIFIVLEGGEGTGKSTIGKWLKQKLEKQGKKVFLTREPGGNGSPVAEKIRKIILDKDSNVLPLTEAYLFAASRAQHVREVIIPHLLNDEIVLCDRFVYSSYAYQGSGRKLGIENIKNINALAVDNCLPDLVLVFDLEPRLGIQRKQQACQDFNRLDNENLKFHQIVREAYLELARENSDLFKIIEVNKPLEEVEKEVWQQIKNKLNF
ncbi:MAG TPA: dTMP kinase [Candidatus Paceibacterota bacterium]|nr:dTMP kinase [Candidatus Paceibacterota bacterium]